MKLKLINILWNVFIDLNKESKKIYQKFYEPFLQEQSHSFGFKPLTDIYDYMLTILDKETNYEDISYILLEQKYNQKKYFIKECQKIDIMIIFSLIIKVIQKIEISAHKMGKLFQSNLEFISEDTALYSFKPLYDLKDKIIKELDTKVFLEENGLKSEKDYDFLNGMIYWYCIENEYGKKNLSIYINQKEFKINNEKKLLTILKNLKINRG